MSVSMKFSERVRDPTTEFAILKTLGKGSFGAVYHAKEIATGIEVAIKKLTVVQEADLRDTIKEIEIMKQCDCEFIVRYYDNFFKKDEIWIIIEFCSQGSLTDILTQRKKVFSEPMIAVSAHAVLRGLVYLHKLKKIHRDVKPQNILVGDSGVPKLADFGIAGQLGGDRTRTDTMIGTPYFLAPEIIVNELGYNERVDVWALGISCIQLAEMAPPHADVNPMRALLLITTSDAPMLKNPDKWSRVFVDFLHRLLTKEPLERPTASDMLSHSFVTDNPDPNAMVDYVASVTSGATRMNSRSTTSRSDTAPAPLLAPPQLHDPHDDVKRGGGHKSSSKRDGQSHSNSSNNNHKSSDKKSKKNDDRKKSKTPRDERESDEKSNEKSNEKSSTDKSSTDKSSTDSSRKSKHSSREDDAATAADKPLVLQRAVTDLMPATSVVRQEQDRLKSGTRELQVPGRRSPRDSGSHAPHNRSPRNSGIDLRPPAPAAPPPLSLVSGMPVCIACGDTIDGKHMVVGDSRWHKEHFRCSMCDELLAKDGFVHKDGALFCRPHYHEKYSPLCGGCGERITSGGYASALGQSWHPDHLVCAACRKPFKSGRFIAKGNKPFCDKQCHTDFLNGKGESTTSTAATNTKSSSPALRHKSAVAAVPRRSSGTNLATAATTSSRVSNTASSGEAPFSEHLNRFAFFKKFYLEICTEASELPDAAFVTYVDSCIALRRKVSVLQLNGEVTSAPWTASALMLVARAIVKASTFAAPQAVQFSENMAIATIDLSNASLGGEHVEALNALLGCSFPLRELLFANNAGLAKKALVELTEALCRRKSLQRIDLSNCALPDKPLQHVLSELVKVKTDFQALDLSNNQLSSAAAMFVGDFVNSNPSMLEVRLSGNKIGDKGVVDLVKRLALPQHTSLRVLMLADVGLKHCTELAQWINDNAKHRSALTDCRFLAELDLSNNALDAEFAQFAGQLIATPACPATLNLASNKFNAKASKLLVDGLTSAKSAARDLSLGGCDLADAAMGVITDALRASAGPPLVRLSMRDCSITAAGFSLLAKALKGGGKLVELDLAFNKISADSAEELASAIVSGNVIDELNIAVCHLNKKSLSPICKLVRHSGSLTKLHVDGNDWGAAQLQELATALEFNTRLELLTMRNMGANAKEVADFVVSLSNSVTLRALKLEQNGLEKAPQAFVDKLALFKFMTVTWK